MGPRLQGFVIEVLATRCGRGRGKPLSTTVQAAGCHQEGATFRLSPQTVMEGLEAGVLVLHLTDSRFIVVVAQSECKEDAFAC